MGEQRQNGRRTVWILAALVGVGGLIAAGCYLVRAYEATHLCHHPPGRVDAARLEAHVRALSETFVPRDHGHPENLERAADYLVEALTRAGGRVRSEPYTVEGVGYRNVIATFGPESEERLVIGAHYDAAEGAPGADGNASGVAELLELAALLGARPPPMQVDLVGFTLEEPPHFREPTQGSRVHARALREQGVRVRAMISLESLGSTPRRPTVRTIPWPRSNGSTPVRGTSSPWWAARTRRPSSPPCRRPCGPSRA